MTEDELRAWWNHDGTLRQTVINGFIRYGDAFRMMPPMKAPPFTPEPVVSTLGVEPLVFTITCIGGLEDEIACDGFVLERGDFGRWRR